MIKTVFLSPPSREEPLFTLFVEFSASSSTAQESRLSNCDFSGPLQVSQTCSFWVNKIVGCHSFVNYMLFMFSMDSSQRVCCWCNVLDPRYWELRGLMSGFSTLSVSFSGMAWGPFSSWQTSSESVLTTHAGLFRSELEMWIYLIPHLALVCNIFMTYVPETFFFLITGFSGT